MLFVPPRKGGKEEEADECKDNGDDSGKDISKASAERAAGKDTHIRYGNTILSLKVFATHIKFRGSWSTDTCVAKLDALLLHKKAPPSGLMHMPK